MDWVFVGSLCLNAFLLLNLTKVWRDYGDAVSTLKNQNKTLDEMVEKLIERNEQLEPSARLLDQDDTPVLQDCKRDAKL